MYKIGQYVRIADPGKLYSNYADMCELLNLSRWMRSYKSNDYRELRDRIGLIISSYKETQHGKTFYGVRIAGLEYDLIFGESAFGEVVSIVPDSLFKM